MTMKKPTRNKINEHRGRRRRAAVHVIDQETAARFQYEVDLTERLERSQLLVVELERKIMAIEAMEADNRRQLNEYKHSYNREHSLVEELKAMHNKELRELGAAVTAEHQRGNDLVLALRAMAKEFIRQDQD